MVKIAATVILTTMAVAPILAAPVWNPKPSQLNPTGDGLSTGNSGSKVTTSTEKITGSSPHVDSSNGNRIKPRLRHMDVGVLNNFSSRKAGNPSTAGSYQPIEGRDLYFDETLEARGPFGKKPSGFRKLLKVGGGVASGVSTIATLSSLIPGQQQQPPQPASQNQQRDLSFGDLEDRAFGKLEGLKKLGKVVSTVGAVADGLSTAVSLSSMFRRPSPQQRRELTYEDILEAREELEALKEALKDQGNPYPAAFKSSSIPQNKKHTHLQGRAMPQVSAGVISALAGVGKAVVAGISLGSAFAPFAEKLATKKPQQKRDMAMGSEYDLDSREINSATILKIGKALASATGFAAIVGGSAIAAKKQQQQQQRRDLSYIEGIETREPNYENIMGFDSYIRDEASLDELD